MRDRRESAEDEVTVAESGGIDIAQEVEDEADAVAFNWARKISDNQRETWRRGGAYFIE